MEQTLQINQNVTEDDVAIVLSLMAHETNVSKSLHKNGVDTQFTSFLRNFLTAPHEIFLKMNEQLSDMFPDIFIKLLDKNNLLKKITKIGFAQSESSLSFWIYINNDNYNFDTRGEIYEAHASLAGMAIFSTINPELLVLKEDEIELPENYTLLKLS
mgnify:CR=1 FL=1